MASNILTASGVVCVLVAVFALAGIWWALLLLGFVLLAAGFTSWRSSSRRVSSPVVPVGES